MLLESLNIPLSKDISYRLTIYHTCDIVINTIE